MPDRNTCFLFPAFVLKYQGNEMHIINSFGTDFYEKLKQISEICDTNLTDFDITQKNYLDNELKNQLITYVFSCCYSDILHSGNIYPDNVAGLSMGIYAALYSSKSISFEDGALLIDRIYILLQQITKDNSFAMMNVVGLSEDDLLSLTDAHHLQTEIVIRNGNFSFILSGKQSDTEKLNELVRPEGALYSNIFPVSIPYHSSFLRDFERIGESGFSNITIHEPSCKIYSAVSQKFVHSSGDIRSEIIKNLVQPVNWQQAMQKLNTENRTVFYECGPGNSMTKIAGFLDGDYRVKKISRQCESINHQKIR
jgi:[acyl-carrier-protein] S-malonyltransferase